MDKIINLFKYIADITGVFKGSEELKAERARRKRIKNDVFEKEKEIKKAKLDNRLKKVQSKKQ